MSATQALPSARPFPVFRRIQDWRMSQKLLVTFLLMSLIPMGFAAFSAIQSSRNALLAQGELQLTAASRSTSAAIDEYLISHREDIVANSMLSSIVAFTVNPNDTALRATALRELKSLANKKDIQSLAIVNKEGTIILSSSDPDIFTTVATRPYFQEAMRGASYISDPSVALPLNTPAIFFSAPILDSGGNILGVVRSYLTFYGIWDLVEADKDVAGPGTYGLLIDDNGIRIADSFTAGKRQSTEAALLYRAIAPVNPETAKAILAEKRLGNAAADQIDVMPLPEVQAALANPGIKTFESASDHSPVRHEAAISALRIKPWHYVLMTPLPTFTSPADNLGVLFAVQALVVALVVIVAVLLISRTLTRPIVQLTQIADRISLGELDAKIDIDQKDEIGELAEAVSRMQASLQAAIERLRARRSGA